MFLVSVPFSIRHIFGYDPVGFMEWKAISVYGTDILISTLFIYWAIHSNFKFLIFNFKKSDWLLVGFVAVAGISITNAIDQKVALFQWLKLIEMAALYFYVKYYVLKRFELSKCFIALVIGGLIQSAVAISQFMVQHSIGLKYLGESVLAPNMTAIAAFFSGGVKIMRAYGTTVHSNVLAAYLFLSLAAFYFISIYEKRKWFWYLFHAVTIWAFLLTFSRVIIGIWLLNFIIRTVLYRFYPSFKKVFWSKTEMRQRGLKVFTVTVLVCLAFSVAYWPYVKDRVSLSGSDEAFQLRVFYNQEALFKEVSLFGVGIGNFVPWLMRQPLPQGGPVQGHPVGIGLPAEQYQPVHNIYLLIYSELGIVGLALFLLFLVFVVYEFVIRTRFKRPYHVSFALIFASVLAMGLFDHFYWTIQSGQLLFWLTVGLISSNNV